MACSIFVWLKTEMNGGFGNMVMNLGITIQYNTNLEISYGT
jgi:hypothetical protein